MNRNTALRTNIRKQNNNAQGAIKRVRFSASQQWRLNRPNNPPNIKKAAPNRTIINRNLKMIKAEQTPLKRAQRAYYGSQSRSPLLAEDDTSAGAGIVTASALSTVRASASDTKLPVHARLGIKRNMKANNIAIAQLQKKRQEFVKRQEIIKEKIRIIENAKRNSLNRRSNVQLSRRLNYGGLRSDQIIRTNQVPRKNVQRQMRVNRQRMNVRQNGNLPAVSPSASDLTVSVANDAAVMNGLANSTFNNLSTDLNPRLQQEIALIQQMSRSQRASTIDVGVLPPAIPGLTVTPSQAIHGLNVVPIGAPPVTTLIQPTVVMQQQSARPKLTLNERFRSLKS